MVTVVTALYPEAQPFLAALSLKKDGEGRHFQSFSDENGDWRVLVTGPGLCAAVAATVIFARHEPGEGDFLVNFGSCAGFLPIGTVVLCNKLTEAASGRTFYPDVLYRHPFAETSVTTAAREVHEGEFPADGVCDMEAALLFQAGSYFFAPHRMIFLKAVTDHGERSERAAFEKVMRDAAEKTLPFLQQLSKIGQESGDSVREETLAGADAFCEALHGSESMRTRLRQMAVYGELTGVKLSELRRAYEAQGRLPAKDKREGKKILDELQRRFL